MTPSPAACRLPPAACRLPPAAHLLDLVRQLPCACVIADVGR
ncbi:hypothetical protein ACFQ61_32975 [Streptomyces sp. NPDC056500]